MIPASNDNAPDKAHFCPICSSAHINATTLLHGVTTNTASCGICGWQGPAADLVTFRFEHGMGSPEEVFQRFFLEIRGLMAKEFGVTFCTLLLKWGFLSQPIDKKHFARYLAAISRGIINAIVETRSALEKERHSGKAPANG